MPDPDKIETLDEWSSRLSAGGCCSMPFMDFVQFECRSAAAWSGCGTSDPDGPKRLTYRTRKITYPDGHVKTVTSPSCDEAETVTCEPMSVVTTWALDPDSIPDDIDDTTTELGDFILGDYAPKTHTRRQRTISATYHRTFTKTYAADCSVTESYGGSASLDITETTTVTIDADVLRGVTGSVDVTTKHISGNATWASDGSITGSKVTTWTGEEPLTEEGSDCHPGAYFQAKIDETVTPTPTHYAIEYSDVDAECGTPNPDDNWQPTLYRAVTTTAIDTHVEIESYKIDPTTNACVTAFTCTPLTITTTVDLDGQPDNVSESSHLDPGFENPGPPFYGRFYYGYDRTDTVTYSGLTYHEVTTKTYGAPDATESETEPTDPTVGMVWKKIPTGDYFICTGVTEAVTADPDADPPIEAQAASATWAPYDTCSITEGCSGSYGATVTTRSTTSYIGDANHTDPPDDQDMTWVYSFAMSWEWVPEVKAVEEDLEATPPVIGVAAIPGHCRTTGTITRTNTGNPGGQNGTTTQTVDTDYVAPDPPPNPATTISVPPSMPEGCTYTTTVDPAPIPEELVNYTAPISNAPLWADPVTGKERGLWIDEEGYGTPDDVTYGVYTHFGYYRHSLHLNGEILDVNDDIAGGYSGKRRTYYRWKIPTSWTGNKAKITWDVLTTPALQAQSLEKDLTWQFEGPGTGDHTNSSWYSPTFILEPPDVTGRKEIVNIRFNGLPNNPYGTKPQVTGRAFELPAP